MRAHRHRASARHRAATTTGDAVRFLRRPKTLGSLDATSVDRIAALGVRALLFGSLLRIAVGWLTSRMVGVSGAQTIGMLAWAAVRLAILVVLAPAGRVERVRAYAAWAVSLVPFALGATEGLRFLALAASAWLCLDALQSLGESRRTARTMVLWSFGGQAGVVALGWLVRGGVAAMISLP